MRSEYTVYGDAINLSARLMVEAANGLGSVLCDYTTHQLAAGATEYIRPEPVKVRCLDLEHAHHHRQNYCLTPKQHDLPTSIQMTSFDFVR